MNKIKLQEYHHIIKETILRNQNSITGLIPASDTNNHAWVRDNCYAVLSVWALSLAYRKIPDLDEDRSKGYELEKCSIKLMRGLLKCFLKQAEKVEAFKTSQRPFDSLHAKFNSSNCNTVVSDYDWGHLQIDATALFLLTLAQMTASGILIIWTIDEAAFIQNLIFYIETAYRTPDYGIWERGDKTNHGYPELNTSSVAMAKAALEALSDLDLFGPHGGPHSVMRVFPDECKQCRAVIESMLPRESYSKELDAALLSIISYPAFAVDNPKLIKKTQEQIITNLLGRYGSKRFMRDGYLSPKEDINRLHYEPHELRVFEQLECEWPMFFAYLALDACFRDDYHLAHDYIDRLEAVLVTLPSGCKVVPETYAVMPDTIDEELRNPGSQKRVAKGKTPHIWGQSLYLLAKLVIDNVITPGEIDPLGRRMVMERKNYLVVQVAILVENQEMKKYLQKENIESQTGEELFTDTKIKVFPARILSYILKGLGKSEALNMNGRSSKEVGILATSRLYKIGQHMIGFQPQFLDTKGFYLSMDFEFIMDVLRTNVGYLYNVWNSPGRPLLIIKMYDRYYKPDGTMDKSILTTLKKLNSGYTYGANVRLGKMSELVTTSFVTDLAFLHETGDEVVQKHLPHQMSQKKGKFIRQMSSAHDSTSSFKSYTIRRKSLALETAVMLDLEGLENLNNFDNMTPAFNKLMANGCKSPEEEYIELKKSSFLKLKANDEAKVSTVHLKNLVSEYHGISHSESMSSLKESPEALIERLKTSIDLAEQGEILFVLYQQKGLDWLVEVSIDESYTVKELLVELYQNAGKASEWWLVRFIAGILNKRVDILAESLNDLLIRQKQVTVGLPPEPREIVICAPMAPKELLDIIRSSCGDEYVMTMLTQEILVYLAMVARTEPQLLSQMLRIRVGLIIQVMASELGRALKCSAAQASNSLFDLSPSQTKLLLQHILAGREFNMTTARVERKKSGILSTKPTIRFGLADHDMADENNDCNDASEDTNRLGQWIRRRKIDGALNRVPSRFYEKLWKVIERSHGVLIGNRTLGNNLTREMTKGEIKFALVVESIINTVPVPEYRQLIVEALCVLSSLVELDREKPIYLNYVISLDDVLSHANYLFLQDQQQFNGDSTLCCAKTMQESLERRGSLLCRGYNYICMNFYDCCPSGRYGTMTYLMRSFAETISLPPDILPDSFIDCNVQ